MSYISLQIHHIFLNVYWNIEVSTYSQNGEMLVDVVVVETPVIIPSCHMVKCSAKLVVCGCSSY